MVLVQLAPAVKFGIVHLDIGIRLIVAAVIHSDKTLV
jgi:hypothetical protein